MQAGVPIVPIVIRNAGELMWRGASTIRGGHGAGHRAAADADRRLDGRGARQARRRGARALPRDPRRVGRPAAPEVQVTTGPTGPVAAPLEWGTAAEMNPLETAMWRGELADPRLRSNVTLLELLDVTPEWDRLLAAHEWASRMVPRMRQRVVEPALGRRRARVGHRRPRRRHRARVARPPDRRLAARAARPGAGVRPQAVRPRPAAVAGAARRGPAGRGSGVRRGHPPLAPPTASARSSSWRGCTAGPASTTRCGPSPRRRWRASRTRSGCWRARWRARSRAVPADALRAADPARGGPRDGARRGRAVARAGRRARADRARRCWPRAAASGTSTCSTCRSPR